MEIFIPTAGRAQHQPTLQSLPMHWRARTTLVVYPEELNEYSAHWPGTGIVTTPSMKPNIARKRQIILDHIAAEDKILFLDDDLTFATRRLDEPSLFRPSDSRDMRLMLATIADILDQYPVVTVCPREGGHLHTGPSSLNTRINRVMGVRRDRLRMQGARFDDVNLMEDFHVALVMLENGYQNIQLNRWAHNQSGSNTAGGCSTWRTPEIQEAAARDLALLHPRYVSVVEKETKTAWGGGKRYDVRVQWKKAYKEATEQCT